MPNELKLYWVNLARLYRGALCVWCLRYPRYWFEHVMTWSKEDRAAILSRVKHDN